LRRRLGWRQVDLARAADCSQTMVSLVERGHLARVPLPVMRRMVAALDATLFIEVRWRAGALERLIDEDHATLVARVAELLRRHGWQVEFEVTYSEYGERGAYDLLAFHQETGIVLVVEVKTDLASAERTFRKLDEKVRLATTVARKRFGWRITSVAKMIVMPEASTLRRRVERHAALFDRVLPARGTAIRRWLAQPTGGRDGLWFLSASGGTTRIRGRGGRERVRRPKSPPASGQAAA